MATTKKTDSGKPAPKQTAARKPAAKKTAAKKTTAKKPAAKKAVETPAVKPAKKVSAAKTRAKAERKAPEKVPGRKERRGVVVSDAMDKTIVAQKHERYGKVVRRSSKLHVHDEQNAAGVGDLVRVVETRPLSASKRWRLLEILEKAK